MANEGTNIAIGIERSPEGEQLAFIEMVRDDGAAAFHASFTREQLGKFLAGLAGVMFIMSSPEGEAANRCYQVEQGNLNPN